MTPHRLGAYALLVAVVAMVGCAGMPPAPETVASASAAGPTARAPRSLRGKKLGVATFLVEGATPQGAISGLGIAEDVATALAAQAGVSLVESGQIDRLVAEIKFQRKTGLVSDETMAEVGRMAGADALVTGSAVVRGGLVRLNARVVWVEDKVVQAGAQTTGPVGDLFRLEDELARALALLIGGGEDGR